VNRSLRLLIVEDLEDDALLVVRELRHAGYNVAFERVDTEEAMRSALAKQTWDLVLADYTMPRFSGLAALELLKTSENDIPFIIISGSIGEDLAVAAMKAGAHDYMMKHNLRRLIPSIERELREAEVRRQRRRAEEQVRRNLEQIKALHEIDKAITSSLKLQTILDVLLEKIDLLFPYAAATIQLINKETGDLEPVAYRNVEPIAWMEKSRTGLRSLSEIVLKNRVPLTIADIQTDPRCLDQEFARTHGLVCYLGVPLIVKDQILGIIAFFTKKTHSFSDEEINFLSTLAGQTAIAIHNSQLYEETRRQMVELEKSNKTKDEFLSVMSHELRTPLNVVTGYTSMVKDGLLGDVNPEQQKALDRAMRRASELLTTINSILYATSLAAEMVVPAPSEINLKGLFGELKADYEILLDKELELIWDYPHDLPIIRTDHAKLKHILQNIINNAIKFTEKGHVRVSARYLPEAKAVEFKVADSGIGIPKEKLPIIFEMFRQVDSSETRSYGGVGIGLYIAKKFAELLGGRIDVETEPGKGSTLTITIPSVIEVPKRSPSAKILHSTRDPSAIVPAREHSTNRDSAKVEETD
jgi:signal transduction histidine kinase/DNA-binding response OmpR family regulator